MGFLKGFKRGLKAFFDAVSFIFRHRLTHYFIYPFVLSILYWIGGLQIISGIVDSVEIMIAGRLDIEASTVEEGRMSWFWNFWETLKAWYNDGYTVIIAIVVRIAMWGLLLLISKYVLLAILSPVLALLSERTEEIVTGKTYPFDLKQLIKDALRGSLVALRNFFAEMSLLLVLWIITLFLPFLAPFSAIFSLLIGAFYYGFSMIDYVNERKKMSLKEGFSYIRGRRGESIALGLGIAFGMTLPLLGFIIASFTAIIGAVAAVLAEFEGHEAQRELNYRSTVERIDP
ncbi:MAG: EI24 domain-containing protein [Flavobacteriales bacterium]|nr:EI24 domain-containing protein [Flavobacteriales bacterium]